MKCRILITRMVNKSKGFFIYFYWANACRYGKTHYLCTRNQEITDMPIRIDSLAQQVEHNTFNVGVLGSSPRRIT